MRAEIYAVMVAIALVAGLAPASHALAYQYDGPMEQVSNSPSCAFAGYGAPFDQGRGVAIHIRGLIRLGPAQGDQTEIVRISPFTETQSPFNVSILALKIQKDSSRDRGVAFTVSRSIYGLDNQVKIIDYPIADTVSTLRSTTSMQEIQSGDLRTYEVVDLWYYIFPNSTWIETQSGPSALGRAYNALTLFGFARPVSMVKVNVMNGCSTIPSALGARPRVRVYSLSYTDFQRRLDADYAKFDAPLTLNGSLQPIRDRMPLIENGRRRLAAALFSLF